MCIRDSSMYQMSTMMRQSVCLIIQMAMSKSFEQEEWSYEVGPAHIVDMKAYICWFKIYNMLLQSHKNEWSTSMSISLRRELAGRSKLSHTTEAPGSQLSNWLIELLMNGSSVRQINRLTEMSTSKSCLAPPLLEVANCEISCLTDW